EPRRATLFASVGAALSEAEKAAASAAQVSLFGDGREQAGLSLLATREWTEVTVAWPEPQALAAVGQDAVCDQLRAGGAVLPLSYRCFRVRVFP
ncbi:MAG: hypothetical protein ACXWVT_13400, partial [Burkholderiaceae bacterium]